MPNVKAAISLDEELFQQAEDLASRMNVTRSGLYSRALSEFVARKRREELLAHINAVCGEEPDAEVRESLAALQAYQSRRLGEDSENPYEE
jgi:predicted transcriptional regulator